MANPPLTDFHQILHIRRYAGHNHLCKFWFQKIKGFGIYGGQILGSPIEMAGHPYNSVALPHSLWWKKISYLKASQKPILKLRSVTCHMGSHTVTCYPTKVNMIRLNRSQTGWYSTYSTGGIEDWVDLGGWLVHRPADSHREQIK